jgi:hypothetical protein
VFQFSAFQRLGSGLRHPPRATRHTSVVGLSDAKSPQRHSSFRPRKSAVRIDRDEVRTGKKLKAEILKPEKTDRGARPSAPFASKFPFLIFNF